MIPATTPAVVPPVPEVTYDQWVPVSLSGGRIGPGQFSMSLRLRRCRVIDDIGSTELAPDAVSGAELDVTVPDIYAPAGFHGPWWTDQIRTAVGDAAAGIIAATAAVGYSKGVL